MRSGELSSALYRRVLDLAIVLGVMYFALVCYGEVAFSDYLLLAIITFFVCSYVFEHIDTYRLAVSSSMRMVLLDTLIEWAIIVLVLLLILLATNIAWRYPILGLAGWVVLTPLILVVVQLTLRLLKSDFGKSHAVRSAVIVCVNQASLRLFERTQEFPQMHIRVQGFFDDRDTARLQCDKPVSLLGDIASVAGYVRQHNINLIYISKPLSAQSRLLSLLEELQDTTASVYFLPDVYSFDLIQARFDSVAGVPVVGICESPFTGVNDVVKRLSDLVIATVALLLLMPLLLVIAFAVKFSSPGPVLFKQRRYGLHGEEILVYKFRSMRVCEDGAVVTQATKQDPRVTRVGAFLRKTSLDELPQFYNVLQGRMSVVGPRPHAVAHNEFYRKQIKGYMLRHKVRPGITGWAQVNGCRGETEQLDKMVRRIEYDLDYLRRWSLLFDLWIVLKTVWVVLKRENAH